ncbi:MAG: hypothetical protein LBG64_03415 [Pseudomonadales bacterium]|jgi:hypothetical protein|nr:hypothetical protein [Pseudomonadales bacterium]
MAELQKDVINLEKLRTVLKRWQAVSNTSFGFPIWFAGKLSPGMPTCHAGTYLLVLHNLTDIYDRFVKGEGLTDIETKIAMLCADLPIGLSVDYYENFHHCDVENERGGKILEKIEADMEIVVLVANMHWVVLEIVDGNLAVILDEVDE